MLIERSVAKHTPVHCSLVIVHCRFPCCITTAISLYLESLNIQNSTDVMRILKFIGAFVGTLLVVFLIVFGFNLDALVTLYENSGDLQEGQQWVPKTQSLKGLTEYIGENPDHVSITSIVITDPDSVLNFREEKPRTMGVTGNFFLIATYARLAEEGAIDPEEQVPLADVDRYQLPYIDQSNHSDAFAGLENSGSITDENTVSLDDLIRASIRYNDLAISDFLLFRFGAEQIQETYRLLKVQHTDRLLPFSGLYILINPYLYDTDPETHFSELQEMPRQAFNDSVFTLSSRFAENEDFRASVTQIFEEKKGLGIMFTQRRDALALFPRSTSSEMSRLMQQLNNDELVSASISSRIKDIMNWPMKVNSRLENSLNDYGAIYDNRLGLVSGIDYGTSAYNGDRFGQAISFDSLQVAFWFHMSSNLIHQDYMQRLMWDPALRAATENQIRLCTNNTNP